MEPLDGSPEPRPSLSQPGSFRLHRRYGDVGFLADRSRQTFGSQRQTDLGGEAWLRVPDVIQGILSDLEPHLPGCFFFQVMCFVHDQVVVVGNQAAAHGKVGKQQRVVDHYDVGLLRSLPG